jgi:hypothetical protein
LVDIAESARWHDVMIERAHRSCDPQLVDFSLHCKAKLLADSGDGLRVLELTGAGLAQRDLIPKARVLLQQAAHGGPAKDDAGFVDAAPAWEARGHRHVSATLSRWQ